MELRRLRCFRAAADELSFRRAAALVGVGQPVVSRQVAALEDELGVALFERRSTGVRLTQAGRVFQTDASRIIDSVDRAREAVLSAAFGTSGKLRLAICEDATTPVFAAILVAHREQHPAVDLELFELPSTMQPTALRRGEIDAGLLLPPVEDAGLQIDELWREDWLVAMPSKHRLAELDAVPIRELATENFIATHPKFGPGCHAQSQALFDLAGIKPTVVARAFRRSTVAVLVRSGAGIALFPGSFAATIMDGVVTRPLTFAKLQMHVAVAYPAGDMEGVVAQFLRVSAATAKGLKMR
ncbi:LysR substrate-binding domain-containing protein [Gymnodinialimonas sp. 2305UL16-5]|uniref:LysR family transcriptional regulator n=1 Tax=Gymnodinialimonas mytili TaxID=3126503 RepID=UPI003099708E